MPFTTQIWIGTPVRNEGNLNAEKWGRSLGQSFRLLDPLKITVEGFATAARDSKKQWVSIQPFWCQETKNKKKEKTAVKEKAVYKGLRQSDLYQSAAY